MELQFRRVRDGNNGFGKPLRLEIVIANKQVNSEGLQLADLVARPIGLRVLRPRAAQPHLGDHSTQAMARAGGCHGDGKRVEDLSVGEDLLPPESRKAPERSQEPSAGRVVPTHLRVNYGQIIPDSKQ